MFIKYILDVLKKNAKMRPKRYKKYIFFYEQRVCKIVTQT